MELLKGNDERNTVVTHALKPFQARWIRLTMTECILWCCIRWALYGCELEPGVETHENPSDVNKIGVSIDGRELIRFCGLAFNGPL